MPNSTLASRIQLIESIFPLKNKILYAQKLSDYAEKLNFTGALDLIKFLISKSELFSDIEIFIFYHDEKLLLKALGSSNLLHSSHEFLKFVNLNDIPLPRHCLISDVNESLNKAMLSEYLGISTVELKKNTKLVGCFTYSVPLKFSTDWAIESGNKSLFFPPFDFNNLVDALQFIRPEFLYGIEFQSPFKSDLGPVQEAHSLDNKKLKSRKGPYKGSFICSREKFIELQSFLNSKIPWLLSKDERSLSGIASKYDSSKSSGRSDGRQSIDIRRHTYGTSLERLVTLFFCSNYKNDEMISLIDLKKTTMLSQHIWLGKAVSASINNKLVITFCDKNYIPVLRKWLKYFANSGQNNLFVFSLDAKTANFCRSNQIKSELIKLNIKSDGLSLLWKTRVDIVKTLVEFGIDVTLTDVDAIWLKNPAPDLFDNNFDIVSSMGTTFPNEVYRELGFVLCFGLITFNSTPYTLQTLRECVTAFDNYHDDQKCLNNILLKIGISNSNKSEIETTSLRKPDTEETVDLYNEDVVLEAKNGLKVKVLSHKMFQRLFDQSVEPRVAHLLTPKEANAKNSLFNIIKQYPSCNITDTVNPKKSSVVWLASYPRSGNTMLRGWLNKNFHLKSCSIYNDVNDIGSGKVTSDLVGHYMVDWPFEPGSRITKKLLLNLKEHQNYSGNIFIKTHACYNNGYDRGKSIYILRNGIDAVISHVHYRQDFGSKVEKSISQDFKLEFEKVVVNGLPMCGYWSDNIVSWLDYCDENPSQSLVLRFEELVCNVKPSLELIREFTGSHLITKEPLLFKDSQSIDNKFYRKGSTPSKEKKIDSKLVSLFYAFEHEGMIRAGYQDQCFDWFCFKPSGEFYPVNAEALELEEKEILLYVLDTIEKHYSDCLPLQINARKLKLAKIADLISYRMNFIKSNEDKSFLERVICGINNLA